jgi:transcriptional antiterminator NusG
MAWYVVEAFEGKDENAYLRLVAGGFKAWRPVDIVRGSRRTGKSDRIIRKESKQPRFGRFIFVDVEMNDFVHSAILQTRNVMRFLCFAGSGEPSQIPAELIEFYKHHRPQKAEKTQAIKPKDMVRITDGPFTGFDAKVVEVVDKRGTLKIEATLFGRPTPLIIEVGHVALVELGQRPPIKPNVKAHSSQLQRA